MNRCFHCGEPTVIWDSDFSFDDFGYEGDGIVQILHCGSCGAEIEYRLRFEEEEGDDHGDSDLEQ